MRSLGTRPRSSIALLPVDADTMLKNDTPTSHEADLECLAQIIVCETDVSWGFDEERGIGYYNAFKLLNLMPRKLVDLGLSRS